MAMLAAGLALLVVTKEGMGAYAPRGVNVGGETCGRVPVHMRHVCGHLMQPGVQLCVGVWCS